MRASVGRRHTPTGVTHRRGAGGGTTYATKVRTNDNSSQAHHRGYIWFCTADSLYIYIYLAVGRCIMGDPIRDLFLACWGEYLTAQLLFSHIYELNSGHRNSATVHCRISVPQRNKSLLYNSTPSGDARLTKRKSTATNRQKTISLPHHTVASQTLL